MPGTSHIPTQVPFSMRKIVSFIKVMWLFLNCQNHSDEMHEEINSRIVLKKNHSFAHS